MTVGNAPPVRTRAGRARAAALVEQTALAGGNLVSFLVFARHLSPDGWGHFGFAYAMVLFAQGFQRAAVTIPLVPYSASTMPWPKARRHWQAANGALAVASLAGLGTVAAIGAASGIAWLEASASMACMMLVPMFAHDFMRRSAIQDARFGLLVASGLTYASLVVLLALSTFWAVPFPWLPTLAVATAASGAAVVVAVGTRQWPMRLPRLWSPAADYPAFARWASLSHLAYSGYNFGIQAVLAGVSGPAAVGVFHACRILVQPVNTLIAATDSVDKPRAAAAFATEGRPGLLRVLRGSLSMMAWPALPYLVLILVFAGPVLNLVLGEQYGDAIGAMRAWCGAAVLMLLAQPVESGLYVARRTRAMFVGRVLGSALALGVAFPLTKAWGATGALAALAMGFAVAAACGLFTLWRLPPSESARG